MSKMERTGWRCEHISQRHRVWGYNCPAVDLDFVVVEYNHGLPVALIEYKDRRAQKPDTTHPTYKALASLANCYSPGAIPFFIAVYCPDEWWFTVHPINVAAKNYYKTGHSATMTEQQFVRSLYLMRRAVISAADEQAISKLCDRMPMQVSA